MNPETNRFEEETDQTPKEWMRLAIGEEVDIKGVKFKVEVIWHSGIILVPVVKRGMAPVMANAGDLERKVQDLIDEKTGYGEFKSK